MTTRTTNFPKRMEKAIFPNNYHVKIALIGCPNDCIKSRMHDFSIIGMIMPSYESYRCVSCGAYVRTCKKKSVGALTAENFRIIRNEEKCIGCGEC